MKTLRLDDIVTFVILGLSVVLWMQATDLKAPFDVYPKFTIGLMGAFAVICLVQNRMGPTTGSNDKNTRGIGIFAMTIAAILVYILSIGTIGYFVSTFSYLAVFFLLRRKAMVGRDGFTANAVAIDIGVAALVTALIALVFKFALKLVFPAAILF